MMGVYIKGMEMPKSCLNCFLSRSGCRAVLKRMRAMEAGTWIPANYRHDDCPLVPVPPHGRLIEESKVLDIVSAWCPDDDGSVGKDGDLREMLDEIEALPTIIPAETTLENEIKIIDTKGKPNYDPKHRFVISAEDNNNDR